MLELPVTVFGDKSYLDEFPPRRKMSGEIARGTDPKGDLPSRFNAWSWGHRCVGRIQPGSFVLTKNDDGALCFHVAHPYELTECEKRGHVVPGATLKQVAPWDDCFSPIEFSGGVCSRCGKSIPGTGRSG